MIITGYSIDRIDIALCTGADRGAQLIYSYFGQYKQIKNKTKQIHLPTSICILTTINSSPVEVHRYTLTPSFIDYLSTNKLPLSYSILPSSPKKTHSRLIVVLVDIILQN